jgi:hypothetical protein
MKIWVYLTALCGIGIEVIGRCTIIYNMFTRLQTSCSDTYRASFNKKLIELVEAATVFRNSAEV